LLQLTFPRGTSPQFVDWVNYAQHIEKAHASSFAHKMEELASGGHTIHTIWFVWAPGYRHFGSKCHQISKDISRDRAYTAKEVLKFQPQRYFEPDILMEFIPRQSVAAPSLIAGGRSLSAAGARLSATGARLSAAGARLSATGARWPITESDSSALERSLSATGKDLRR
jgi:hypothetical protein